MERPAWLQRMALELDLAGKDDAEEIADLRTAAAIDLTNRFGQGHWSMSVSAKGVLWHLRQGDVLVARVDGVILGALALARRKPWAIDASYFTAVRRPCHLTSMAVLPSRQRQGVGRALMAAAEQRARERNFEAIRLDAYQGEAGAGPFYGKCGYQVRGEVAYREAQLIYFEKLLAVET